MHLAYLQLFGLPYYKGCDICIDIQKLGNLSHMLKRFSFMSLYWKNNMKFEMKLLYAAYLIVYTHLILEILEIEFVKKYFGRL